MLKFQASYNYLGAIQLLLSGAVFKIFIAICSIASKVGGGGGGETVEIRVGFKA